MIAEEVSFIDAVSGAASRGVVFDEASHTYTRDGVYLPGVHEVLEGCGLRVSPPEDIRVVREALERGRRFHVALADAIAAEDWSGSGEDAVTGSYLRSFFRTPGLDLEALRDAVTELPIAAHGSAGYAGKLDLCMRDGAGGLVLDPKTLSRRSTKPQRFALEQVAAYAAALATHDTGTRPARAWRAGLVLVYPDGEPGEIVMAGPDNYYRWAATLQFYFCVIRGPGGWNRRPRFKSQAEPPGLVGENELGW